MISLQMELLENNYFYILKIFQKYSNDLLIFSPKGIIRKELQSNRMLDIPSIIKYIYL